VKYTGGIIHVSTGVARLRVVEKLASNVLPFSQFIQKQMLKKVIVKHTSHL
jgi:hypothetical protein